MEEGKRARAGDRATTESPRRGKSPRIEPLPVVVEEDDPEGDVEAPLAVLEADDSGCGGAASLEVSGSRNRAAVAIRDNGGERCEHMVCDGRDIGEIVSKIASASESESDPMCEDETCVTRGRHLMMVCAECDCHFCIGRSANRAKPRGHIGEHALMDGHWVALWYQDPYVGYCFECEDSLTIGDVEGEKKGMMVSSEEGCRASGPANEHGCVFRGIPNLGNTCYLNALLQCLLVLGNLQARMSGPDAPSGILGGILHDLFVATNSVSYTRDLLDLSMLLGHARMYNSGFKGTFMQDSHELLCCLRGRLHEEEKMVRPDNMQQGAPSAVVPTVFDSIFGGQLSVTTSCKCCSCKSVSQDVFYDLSVPMPPKGNPPKSVASPPRNEICVPQQKIHKLFPAIDKANTEKIHTISEGGVPQVPASESKDMVMVKTSEPLKVDSNQLEWIFQSKDAVHGPLQTPTKKVNTQIASGTDVEKTNSAFLDNAFNGPDGSIGAPMDPSSAEVTTEDKGKARSCDSVCHVTEDINSPASIEKCLALHFKEEMIEWKCENCSKIAQKASTISGTDGEQTSGDTSGLSCGEKDSSSCSTPNEKPECLEGAQEDVPSCRLAEKQANLLSGQCPNANIQDRERGKQVNLGRNAQVEENQYDWQDRKEDAIKTHLISKLPPVLVVQLKRSFGPLKVSGHVSFKEILDLKPFMDPSSEDKDNCSYHLVGVVEHLGCGTDIGHFVAYVRPSHQQHSSGSSSWFRASDANIKEISLEEVLKCEAYLLFYERMEG